MRFPKEPRSLRSVSKCYWRVVKPVALSEDASARWWAWAADSSPPLLSNSSLSPSNDLLLLFLVPTKIFLILLSQKLSRKHLRWGSSEISRLKSGQLRISWAWWRRRPVWLEDFCSFAQLWIHIQRHCSVKLLRTTFNSSSIRQVREKQ